MRVDDPDVGVEEFRVPQVFLEEEDDALPILHMPLR